ncbi:MAG: aspartate kinase [Acidiferrobacterales bacterium]|nr:aspartate kinase [Acidiferrobacterales bacterium]
MSIVIEKFGGTSVGSIERINKVAQRVAKTKSDGYDVVVVVSAMAGDTNRLIDLATQIDSVPDPRELDMAISTGEQITIALLSMALNRDGCKATSYTGSQIPIITNKVHGKARVQRICSEKILSDLEDGYVVVVAGFQGVTECGEITTLGRGGSDTTAVALAAALEASECRIYTDVDGVMTADPRIVPNARILEQVTAEEMLELSSSGAKVLQIRAVEFAYKYGVDLRVLSSFHDVPGTLISSRESNMEQPKITGIAYNVNEAKITIRGVPDRPGIASKVFGPIADAHINVDMIIQNVGTDNNTDLTFTVDRSEHRNSLALVEKIMPELGAQELVSNGDIAKISLVGVGMRSHTGIATTMFTTLAAEGINIQMISTSEIKISVIVDEKYVELGVRALHSAFGLDDAHVPTREAAPQQALES